MGLLEMAEEYRISGEKCRKRLYELRRALCAQNLPEGEKYLLRRRITILDDMAREATAISKYLAHYYDGRTTLEQHKDNGSAGGIFEMEKRASQHWGQGEREGASSFAGCVKGFDAEAGADGFDVLFAAALYGRYCTDARCKPVHCEQGA